MPVQCEAYYTAQGVLGPELGQECPSDYGPTAIDLVLHGNRFSGGLNAFVDFTLDGNQAYMHDVAVDVEDRDGSLGALGDDWATNYLPGVGNLMIVNGVAR